jgi:hypothetical protein
MIDTALDGFEDNVVILVPDLSDRVGTVADCASDHEVLVGMLNQLDVGTCHVVASDL